MAPEQILEATLVPVNEPVLAHGGTEYTTVAGLFALLALLVILLHAWIDGRRERQRFLTIRSFVEHGLAPPRELLEHPARGRGAGIRKGLVSIAAGVGIALALVVTPGVTGMWAVGAPAVFVGIAQILGACLTE